mmetsp:Transcript_21293/g.35867  ORF Transcript_21293/g.35867 Transcript_21293/m.35867 type:complete len:89 (-) Transcript_21293:195-461(-)
MTLSEAMMVSLDALFLSICSSYTLVRSAWSSPGFYHFLSVGMNSTCTVARCAPHSLMMSTSAQYSVPAVRSKLSTETRMRDERMSVCV